MAYAGAPLREGHRQRAVGYPHHLEQRLHLGVELGEVRDHLQHAGADLAQSAGDAHEFLPGGGQGGGRLTPAGSVVESARGRETQGAGAHPFGGQAAHLDDLVGCRRFTIGTPLAHDEQPQRPMADLGGDVNVVRAPFDGVQVLGDAAPVPGQALVERSTRDVLDTFHQLDQLGVVGGANGGEANAAVPHHDRGHAVA